ncbi:CocE/NonD family hydrolase [Nocardia cyriacigeorgica]|uniref:CocE/NonD family hydrolase n=4 Tax=Nocardia cyriacigeorgica TaxID=135487 RepID=A0A6P1CYV4_9NOCA|nr:CocE/NonD family hydrolase [Nocardia cyriacigeorgica]NEW43305.1 CocE/NonD family hydrolase [Nocardia cyriacigeorgica]NEW48901.1 CocE/NonD family hydrolase [Nocardia cyriacigeorgica]
MRIGFDLEVPMADGVSLRADVYLPVDHDPVPVIMTMGPYGKGRRFQDEPYAYRWNQLIEEHPEILEHSPCDYMTYETVDPQLWTAAGYAVVRVDSRGSGASPGHLEILSDQETRDYYEAIEWAGVQPWSTGKVGLCGISYYAINQWRVAALQPPHLAAICPWEGALDNYRDMTRHGGILSNVFYELWYPLQVLSNQHGLGDNGPLNPWTGAPATGTPTLTETQLAANRTDPLPHLREHALDDSWHRARTPDPANIQAPILSAANWFGQGLHNRGNFEGFTRAGSTDKWLEVHPGRHEEWFYLPESVALQQMFFDHYLKGHDNGFTAEPRVRMSLVDPDGGLHRRTARQWPPEATAWSQLHLNADHCLSRTPADTTTEATVDIDSAGVTFTTEPLESTIDLIGPLAARLHVSTTAADADLFLTLRAFRPDGSEVTVIGSTASLQPLSNGWLRLSHRELDPQRSLPWRPWHPHQHRLPVEPGRIYEIDVEIWPTGIRLPVGHRLGLTVAGGDLARPGEHPLQASLCLHTDIHDRAADTPDATTTLHFGQHRANTLLVPTSTVEDTAAQ